MKNLLYFLFYSFTLYACQTKTTTSSIEIKKEDTPVPVKISDERWNASGPYLTKDHKGNILLSWVQAQDSSETYLLSYAISSDGGQIFSKPQSISTTQGIYPHDENLSKILFKPNGDMMAMFAVSNPNPENSYAGLVYYTQSFDGGHTWTNPKQLAKDTISSIDERYFDIALLPDGEIGTVWLDSRKDSEKEGSSLYYSATEGRSGFIGEKVLDRQTCQCCRTDLFVEKGNIHVAYRAILNDSIRDMMHIRSEDGGKTFSSPIRISADNWVIRGCPHTGPSIASNEEGLHVAWYTMGRGSGVFYTHSTDKGKTFSGRENVSGLSSAKHPQMNTMPDGKLCIVWDEKEEKEGKLLSRIGLQLREKEGKVIETTLISPEEILVTHPVLTVVDQEHILVAYTRKKGTNTEVYYQTYSVSKPVK